MIEIKDLVSNFFFISPSLWRVAISLSRQNFFFWPKTGKTGKKPAKPSQNRIKH
jgi:hypothetical protein